VNASTALARIVVGELVRAGVGHVVLCPGSRSAPLAYLLARPGDGPVLHVRHDERVAAFTALGVGLSGDGVGAVVTTSGTAAANLHPAVLEAHHANRSLVVITANRPARLRGTWANQTSELQAALFGAAVRAAVDLEDVDAAKDPQSARTLIAQALAALRGGDGSGRPGPVHLDLGFSDPLLPDEDPWDDPRPRHTTTPSADRRAWSPAAAAAPVAAAGSALPAGPLTVVVAGDGAGPAARRFAEVAGLPLLAEPSSGSRGGPNAVGPYRLLLDRPELGGAVERVVAVGRPTLSRPVTRLLARPDVELVLVSPHTGWPDPGRPAHRVTSMPILAVEGSGSGRTARWLSLWQRAAAAAATSLDALLDADAAAGRLSGPLLARELIAALRPGEAVLAAASNPIRDLDLAAHPSTGPAAAVLSNRGLAGIDGTVSTATGVALAAGPGVVTRVLVGDLAFLHDLNALLAVSGVPRPELQVVVLNDDGGGIFSLLEYGERAGRDPAATAEFERIFGTPHGAELAALCRGYGVPHELPSDLAALRATLAAPVAGTSVVEVRADRSGLRELHARMRAVVRRASS
jgi:2-succinyl-5-enolpyruvyl-6-hydroxy-3-cyclohexene-1-carboxylate synthase